MAVSVRSGIEKIFIRQGFGREKFNFFRKLPIHITRKKFEQSFGWMKESRKQFKGLGTSSD